MLQSRIAERFPGSGLSHVAADLRSLAERTAPVIERAREPNLLLRTAVGVSVVLVLVLAIAPFYLLRTLPFDAFAGVGAMFQAIESATQDLIFLSIAIWFLLTLEGRIKRRAALIELHRLRSVVHVVDMHQLTKDPEHLFSPGMTTPSSPERGMTRFELARYLDYCSELLAITSKLAACHVQHINDPVVLSAVSDVEVLASNLANKIWQKIMILDTVARPGGA